MFNLLQYAPPSRATRIRGARFSPRPKYRICARRQPPPVLHTTAMRIEQVGDVALLRLEAGKANAIGLGFPSALDALVGPPLGAPAPGMARQGKTCCAGPD